MARKKKSVGAAPNVLGIDASTNGAVWIDEPFLMDPPGSEMITASELKPFRERYSEAMATHGRGVPVSKIKALYFELGKLIESTPNSADEFTLMLRDTPETSGEVMPDDFTELVDGTRD